VSVSVKEKRKVYGVQSIIRCMRVLQMLAEAQGNPLSLTTVAFALGLHKSTAHRLLIQMSRLGLATRDDVEWYFGPRCQQLCNIAKRKEPQ